MALTLNAWSTTTKLASTAAGLLLALAAGEAALRATDFDHPRAADRQIVWSRERDRDLRRGDGLYRFDVEALWEPRPGARLSWTDGERINADGFRGPQLPLERTKGVLRIASMGGAATLGVGVRWEDTYSAMLAHILRERGRPAEVLCAGVEDHTTLQGLARWRTSVRIWRPHLVLLSFVGARAAMAAPQGRSDPVRLADMRRAPRAVRRGDLRDELRLLHVASWLGDAASGALWRERDLDFILRRLAPSWGALDWPGERRLSYDDTLQALRDLIRECRAEGAGVMLLSIPRSPKVFFAPIQDAYLQGTQIVAEAENALLVDGRNVYVRAVVDEDLPAEALFLGDVVPSECGHLALAKALADEILSRMERR